MEAANILGAFRIAAIHHADTELWREKKDEAYQKNKWFVHANLDKALNQWLVALAEDKVGEWLSGYKLPVHTSDKQVAIIMAGNIPFVGMHDLFCALSAGFRVIVKLSSDDTVLPKFWIEEACKILPGLEQRIVFSEMLKEAQLAIATGSNNSSRYFKYYFKNIPHILRKNRNSFSVLSGKESDAQLESIGHDVFDYFGMGCRNVTCLWLPRGFDFAKLFVPWEKFGDLINHHKYANNYNYHKALLLLNLDPHLDSGFMLFKENPILYSPVGMLNYAFYDDLREIEHWMQENGTEIQCFTGTVQIPGILAPGASQNTTLNDYADNVDTMAWLLQQV